MTAPVTCDECDGCAGPCRLDPDQGVKTRIRNFSAGVIAELEAEWARAKEPFRD